ncbi:MAG: hypothetical protein K1060chlam1_01092 [Candidatus Anoxychlamydiales bacterium]|nr:hypothetical protein [Candidatus Anoxychlamydiales bacterium]
MGQFHRSTHLLSFLDGNGETSDRPARFLKSYLEAMNDKEIVDAATIPVEKIQAPLMLTS